MLYGIYRKKSHHIQEPGMVRKKKRIAKKQPIKKKLSPKKRTSKKTIPKVKAFPKFEKFKKLIMSNPCITPTEAAMQSYNCKDRKVAGVIGSQNLVKLKITMPELLERMGLTDEEDAKDLKKLREAKTTKFFQHEGSIVDREDVEDNQTRLKALELTAKLKGRLVGKVEVTGEVSHKHFIAEAIKKSKTVK